MDWINTYSTSYSWNQLLAIFLLTMCRLGPIVAFTPFLGGKVIPGMARSGLLIVLSILFLPIAATNGTIPVEPNPELIFYAAKELFIGFVISFLASLPFFIVQSSGITIDFMRGSAQLMAQDPSTQNQASPIGILYNYVLLALFFQFDGPFLFFDAIITSYQAFPPFGGLPESFISANSPFWMALFPLADVVFATALRLAAPSILAILMAEMFLGIANRLAPQVQIAFLGMPLKSLLGLMLLFASWFFILNEMKTFSFDTIKTIDKNFSLIK